jgi:hypothetical protein
MLRDMRTSVSEIVPEIRDYCAQRAAFISCHPRFARDVVESK